MAPPPSLTLVPFLQHWDAAESRLLANVLVVPVGDPRLPLGGPPAPPFSGAALTLAQHVSNDPGFVPTLADVPAGGATHTLVAPPEQAAIFEELHLKFAPSAPQVAFERDASYRLKKYLPKSYRNAFSFVAPKTPLAVIDDSYFCALRCPPPTPPSPAPPAPPKSWGDAFSLIMRQPMLARAAGLIHTVSVDLGGGFSGGWLFFTLAAGTTFAAEASANPAFLRAYATRVPELSATQPRAVFTPVTFPVAADAAGQAAFGAQDEVFGEATEYDDGFTKIVHARQPRTAELTADDDTGPRLEQDPGILLGWDDEDVLIGMNRGVGAEPDGSVPPDAPSGVSGYRVDVRRTGGAIWTSLCEIAGPPSTFSDASLGPISGELSIEVHPSDLVGQFWVPSYFARWEGGSLVAPSNLERLLSRTPRDGNIGYAAVGADAVPLRYGQSFEFRVRLADPTGGGPAAIDEPEHAGRNPVARVDMRRLMRLRPVVVSAPSPPSPGSPPTSFTVHRPRIGYPEAVFTGHPRALETLSAIALANVVSGATPTPVEMPDPDARLLEVSVFVQMPAFDRHQTSDGLRLISRTYRAFPDLVDPTAEVPLALTLNWVPAARLSDRPWPVEQVPTAATGPVDVPLARNVRIEVRAVGRLDLNYFASRENAFGEETELWAGLEQHSAPETEPLFEPIPAVAALASVFLQPDPVANAATQVAPSQATPSPLLAKRLAAALDLVEENGVLYGPPGRRVVFACNGLSHRLAPDGSSLTLGNRSELAGVWINAARVLVARDWSWVGARTPGFEVRRAMRLVGAGRLPAEPLAGVALPHAVNQQAIRGTPDRSRTELIIIDAFAPPLDGNGFPREVELSYHVTASVKTPTPSPPYERTISTKLPVATPPEVAPTVVSAGHALGPYLASDEYASTQNRERLLWVEIAEDPRVDPRDVVYGRVVALAPDPMLLPDWEPEADPPALAEIDLDPELVRVIRPGQADDFAGLSAMQPLVRSPSSNVHFGVPLPPGLGPGSPELFGFFTMEFRYGHPRGTTSDPFWCTARGRFGPPNVLEGVQHPAPALQCALRRAPGGIRVSAEYAAPVIDGRRLNLDRPNTEIWFLLYARVSQADGRTRRNVLIDRRSARPHRLGRRRLSGRTQWSTADIRASAGRFGFTDRTPMSVLAAELLPEPNGAFADPLGRDLGEVRLLRTSALVAVPDDCCS